MDKGIDASLGLDVVLMTLQRLRKNGILQAQISHIPGIAGQGRCLIEVVAGKVTSCIVEDAAGNRHTVSIDVVIATNTKRGPFAWTFHPRTPQQPQQPQRPLPDITQASPAVRVPQPPQPPQQWSPQPYIPVISGTTIPVPLRRASDLVLPNNLTANERVILGWIFSLIDGQRTVADITIMLPRLRFEDVRSGLLFLKQIGAITLMG